MVCLFVRLLLLFSKWFALRMMRKKNPVVREIQRFWLRVARRFAGFCNGILSVVGFRRFWQTLGAGIRTMLLLGAWHSWKNFIWSSGHIFAFLWKAFSTYRWGYEHQKIRRFSKWWEVASPNRTWLNFYAAGLSIRRRPIYLWDGPFFPLLWLTRRWR